jgi:hypothetical protein
VNPHRAASFLSIIVAAVVVVSLGACAPAGQVFYDVLRTRAEECAIRSTGEFCVDAEQFAPPYLQNWAVDLGDDVDIVIIDGEVWRLAPLADGDDPWTTPRTAQFEQVVTTGAALCTTTTTSSLEFVANGAVLTGTFRSRSRLVGPEGCGETPIGERVVDTLDGQAGTP